VGDSLGVTLAGLGVFATAYYIGYVISNARAASSPTGSAAGASSASA
jgi:hypothetical protein